MSNGSALALQPSTPSRPSIEEKRERLANLLREKATQSTSSHPLSHGQRALWFLHQLDPTSPAYNLMYAGRIRSTLDVPALERTFQTLVDRHPSLRTTYGVRNGQHLQEVHEHCQTHFEVTPAAGWSETELRERVAEEAHRPFDLEHGPLLRATLFISGPKDYVLLLTTHHIVIDFPSIAILMYEIFAVYAAEKAGASVPLAPLKFSYSDFIRWQTKMLAGAEGEEHWVYWREKLGGELPALNLPTDRPRPVVQTYRGAVHKFELGRELSQQLNTLAQAEGVTLYMLLLAAFQALLHRYSGQDDILIGSPMGARGRVEFENIVGYFANPVVLRADLSADLTFRDFLTQVQESVLGALDHQDYPFPLLVERLQPTRDSSRSPLCDVMFVLQRSRFADATSDDTSPIEAILLAENESLLDTGGLAMEAFEVDERVSQVDMTMMLVEGGGRIAASVPYNADLFDAATIERFGDHYRTLLESIVADPGKRVRALPLLTATERRQFAKWNETEAPYPVQQCIHRLFEAQSARTPEAVAVVFKDQSLTYRELSARANQLAHTLRSLKVGPDQVVGLCLERSVEMVVAVLAILKAGAAYLPLDPQYPSGRLAFMIEDAEVTALVTREKLADSLPEHGAAVICLDRDRAEIERQSVDNPESEVRAENLAYVIYTSGSTGQPKGVMIQHRSAINLAFAHQEAIYREYAGRRLNVSLNAPLAFDGCVERLMLLLFGHTVHVIPEEVRQDPSELLTYVEANELEVLDFTPSQLRLLIDAGMLSRPGFATRLVLVGGEAIDEQLWQLLAGNSRIDFFNVYGPTECTINSAVCWIKAAPEKPNIGWALSNMQLHLLDEAHQVVPLGVPGEIYVAGVGLARGYLNRPELTAERFVPNPFSETPGGRLYRTFDLARRLPDGNVEFLGRVDDQIKIRGHRIELGGIENVLSAARGVKEAVVVVDDQGAGDKRLVAFVVANPTPAPLQLSEIKDHLRRSLPEYMVPVGFVQVESLPLTVNGKLDRHALAKLEQHALVDENSFVAPRNEMEERLAEMWADVLRLPRVGVNDNFFDAGGHSLLATQLVMRIRQAFEIELPLRSIFEAPTAAGMSVRVLQQQLSGVDKASLVEMLDRLETLSDAEVNKLLTT
ncbi:MAG: amino acid adenylation domain-containing protein [Pyrinomonadaceae bacterium]|nr:amino acid adenylation domain-containing protein [Pyrinomonadaceae bacterium]